MSYELKQRQSKSSTIERYRPIVELYKTGKFSQRELIKKIGLVDRKTLKQISILLLGNKEYNKLTKIVTDRQYNSITNQITIPSEDNPKLAWFMGVLCGDGYWHNNMMGLNVTEIDFANKFENIIKELFDIGVKTYILNFKRYNPLKYKNRKNLICKVVHSIRLTKYIQQFDTFKTRTWKVPNFILGSSNKIKYEFLNGLIDSDGTISKINHKNGLSITMGSKPGMESISLLLQSLNIKYFIQQGTFDNEAWNDKFTVYIKHALSLYKLLNHTEFSCPLKIRRRNEQLNYLKSKLKIIRIYQKAIKLRKQMGWGQNKIAKVLGVQPSQIVSWIYYKKMPRVMVQ